MAAVQENITNTRPARAGFIQFRPSPPKVCFTTAMANTDAITGTYSGTVAGML
jgi:hypothetical protein